jgi:pilus assembly protein FimV
MATTKVGVRTATRAVTAACAASLSLPALPLGLGDIEMQSFLNEPLRARVELLDVRDLSPEDIRIRLAQVEDFERLGVDRSYFLTSIEFEVTVDPATGRGLIRLSTPDAVLEPYLDLIIEARWPQGRVLREYTVLVDPPAFRQEMITVSASERVNDPRPEKPAVAPESGGATGDGQGSADAVALRQSSLPPGEMPSRAFSAETATTPRAGSRYMVKRDETLWQIASAGRPGDVSVQQAMLDIQRLNPEAFIDGNINRIKAGYIIYLPAAGEVSSDDLAAALEEVRAQNRAFDEGRTPGVSAAATLRVSADTEAVVGVEIADDRPLAVAPAAPSEPDTARDSVEGDSAGTAPASAGPDEAPGDRATGADGELAAQLASMAERLDTLEQIVALKDEQIAALEQALREAREAAEASPAAAPIPAPATQPRPPVAAPPAASAAPSIPWLPIGGGVIALLLAAALFLRRRASRAAALAEVPAAPVADEEADVFKGVSLKSEALSDAADVAQAAAASTAATASAPIAAPAGTDDLDLNRGGSRGYGERKNDDYIDDGAAGDALAEADIYIAYGRYLQAIELLDTAIENEPENSAYRLKLTELYVDMGEQENAAAQLEALREQGDADAIARAEALLGAAAPAPSPSPEAEPVAAPPAPAAPETVADAGAPEERADAPVEETDAEELLGAAPAEELDLDLDVGEPDLQLDLETESEPQASIGSDDAFEEPAPEAAAIADAVDAEPLEFDQLEIEEDGPLAGDDSDTLDLHEADEPEEILDLTDALGEFSSARLDEPSGDEEDGEDLLIADDVDQMATKLDLARAYVDMGDSEGARGILEEVAAAADGDVQKEARDLLERIS